MKYILEFQNNYGDLRVVGKYDTVKECHEAINKFCEERHFKSYYTRAWKVSETTTKLDVGSHTEFFYITEVNNE